MREIPPPGQHGGDRGFVNKRHASDVVRKQCVVTLAMKFFGKIVTRQHSARFAHKLHVVQVLLAFELEKDYECEFDSKTAGVLAAQVVNYLTGQDLERSYARVDELTKSKIREIKDQIVLRADQKMLNDPIGRETIVYSHRLKMVLGFAKDGDSFLQTDDAARSEDILSKHAAEFRQEVTPDLYDQIVARFVHAKQRFAPSGSLEIDLA